MIISHHHRFIFLKTAKTAGTSIEIALSQHCGDRDVITPVSTRDEQLRRECGARGPQNYLAPWVTYSWRDVARLMIKGKPKAIHYNHQPAVEVKSLVGEEIWNTYYKFCVERNPWDRILSYYFHKFKQEPRPDISSFLDSGALEVMQVHGSGVYRINREIAVDHICRFENLTEELESVRQHLGLPEPLILPAAKSGFRQDRRPAYEMLSSDERKRIAEAFREEIELFGYCCEPPCEEERVQRSRAA